MRTFQVKYKRNRRFSFWKTIKGASGADFKAELNRLYIYFPDGSMMEVSEILSCDVRLGVDWFLAQKEAAEKQAGQNIVTNEAKN